MTKNQAGRAARLHAAQLSARNKRATFTSCATAAVSSYLGGTLMIGNAAGLCAAALGAAAAFHFCRPTEADLAHARRSQIGAEAEEATGRLLQELERQGWKIFHARARPGSNGDLDHVAIPPGGEAAFVINTKRWRRDWDTHATSGLLQCGDRPEERSVAGVLREAGHVSRLLPGTLAVPVLAVHGSTVLGGRLRLPRTGAHGTTTAVHVVDAQILCRTLRSLLREYDLRACADPHLSARFARAFPPYGQTA